MKKLSSKLFDSSKLSKDATKEIYGGANTGGGSVTFGAGQVGSKNCSYGSDTNNGVSTTFHDCSYTEDVAIVVAGGGGRNSTLSSASYM